MAPLERAKGFVVDSNGYIVTNYHVIERAYVMQRMREQYNDTVDHIVGNATQFFGSGDFLRRFFPVPNTSTKIFVRIDKSTEYQPCRIVNVQPDLDVAVLKILNNTQEVSPVSFGSSPHPSLSASL
jgi:S1-C subfamily serine protease